jgi:hypothetical protein
MPWLHAAVVQQGPHAQGRHALGAQQQDAYAWPLAGSICAPDHLGLRSGQQPLQAGRQQGHIPAVLWPAEEAQA